MKDCRPSTSISVQLGAELVEQMSRHAGGAEPLGEVGGPSGAVGAQEPTADLPQRFLLVRFVEALDPLVGAHERDPRPLRRPLAQIGVEERESRAKTRSRSGSDSLRHRFRELGAREAAAVERLPDLRPHRCDLGGAERRMQHARRVAPSGQSLVGRGSRAPRCVPERQLAGGVEVQRSAERPGLDERALSPHRVPDLGLCQSVDACRELQLRGRLPLGLHAAQGAHDLDEAVGARSIAQRRARQPARAHLIPAHLHRD